MTKFNLKGSIVALITPMNEDKSVDYESLKNLVDWHIKEGTHAISVTGTTGESPTLTTEEHCEVISVAVKQSAGRIHIMAGCGSNNTQEAINLAKHAKDVGADSQLQVVPYYNKPTQEGMFQHFKAIAENVDLPMILYNVPGRTIADLSIETILRLAEIETIVGIKEATGNLEKAQRLIFEVPEGFSIYSGDDPTAVALMLCGGHGNISVTANVAPKLMNQLCEFAISGNTKEAMKIQRQLMNIHKNLFVEANPIPVKFAVSQLNLSKSYLRLPLIDISKKNKNLLLASLKEINLV